MYCKLFASLYQGTLRGQSDEILVFTNLLANCDRDGYVDKHFRAIATRYDKLARNFLAGVQLAAVTILLN